MDDDELIAESKKHGLQIELYLPLTDRRRRKLYRRILVEREKQSLPQTPGPYDRLGKPVDRVAARIVMMPRRP
jgi:hypothetical protein